MKKKNYLSELKKAEKALLNDSRLNASVTYIGEGWDFYKVFTGHDVNGDYYDIYLRRGKPTDNSIIEIAHTTKNPELILEILKDSETMADISYEKSETIYTEEIVNYSENQEQ